MLEKIKIGTSPLSNRVNLYRMGKDPLNALETKDVTTEAVSSVVEHLLGKPAFQAVLEARHNKFGAARFIISVRVEGIPDLGTVIQGTHRTQDLLPAFWRELYRLAPEMAMSSIEEYFHDEDSQLVALIRAAADDKWPDDNDLVWGRYEVGEYINGVIMEQLDQKAQPHGLYFGASEGDGSDYGYWKASEE